MKLKDIRKSKDLNGKTILLRSDLNAPIADDKVINTFRLDKARKTIDFLTKAKAKVVLIGHIGREETASLSPVYEYFKKYFTVHFIEEIIGENTTSAVKNMKNGEIVLLENLRKHSGEVANDDDFAKQLASLADIYVNDSFSVSHREHSSIVGLPKYLESFAGILFQEEIKELSNALNPRSPALCILGGAKFNTKEPLIKKMLNVYDKIFVSGALAHDFFKSKGFNIGKSLSSDNSVDINELAKSEKIMTPIDVVVKNKNGVFIKKPNEVLDDDIIKDSGPETIKLFSKIIKDFKFILWNGPLGEYEKGFIKPTEDLAYIIAKSDARTLIGGGDTIAATEHLKLEDKFSFVSTGGGAMLQFLLDGTLVGIEALENGL